jgi:hypothetical protein
VQPVLQPWLRCPPNKRPRVLQLELQTATGGQFVTTVAEQVAALEQP